MRGLESTNPGSKVYVLCWK